MIFYKVWSMAPEDAEWEKLDLKNSKEIITELSDAAHFETGENTSDGVPILKYYRTKAEALKEYRRLLKNKSDPDDHYEDDEDEDEDEDDEGPYQWRNKETDK